MASGFVIAGSTFAQEPEISEAARGFGDAHAARAHERDKVERMCRYVSRLPVAEPRMSLTT